VLTREETGFTLIETSVVLALLGLVVGISLNFLVSADNTINVSTQRSANNNQARLALSAIDASVRYASNVSISADGKTLYVDNGNSNTSYPASNEPACIVWAFNTPGTLTEQTGTTTATLGAAMPWSGVSFLSGVPAFAASTLTTTLSTGSTVPTYAGLISIHLEVNQVSSVAGSGVEVVDSVAAGNMSGLIGTGSLSSCP
jgi:prepilin-type N-terminal cleavage/methylation domain-containing protein